jgi:hypothetical protein
MKKIVWEAWVDPYHGNANDFGIDSSINQQPTNDLFSEENSDTVFGIEPKKIIGTPYGLLSVTEDTLVSSKFEFWVLHTNFDITKDFIQKLEQIPGIETIETFTRYRLRVGFPKTPFFNTSDTKYKVSKLIDSLNEESLNTCLINLYKSYGNKKAEEIQEIYKNINNSKFWNIFIYPNGYTDIIISDKYDDFYKKILLIRDIKLLVGGIIINSEEL